MIKTILRAQTLREKGKPLCAPVLSWQLPIWTKEQDDDAAGFGAGERPPGGPLLWPLLGPALSLRARSTSAADTHHEEMAQARAGTRQGCHLLLQPVSHQRGSGTVCHLTPAMVLYPSFSVFPLPPDSELVDRTVSYCCVYTQCLLINALYTVCSVICLK